MELEQQTTSLELSKKLKELGCKQESLFYWSRLLGGEFELNYYKEFREQRGDFSAFTCAELGEKLKGYNIDYWYSYPDFRLKLQESVDTQGRDENEANARAKMLAYLIENKLIK